MSTFFYFFYKDVFFSTSLSSLSYSFLYIVLLQVGKYSSTSRAFFFSDGREVILRDAKVNQFTPARLGLTIVDLRE